MHLNVTSKALLLRLKQDGLSCFEGSLLEQVAEILQEETNR